jgi:hypothetical protein
MPAQGPRAYREHHPCRMCPAAEQPPYIEFPDKPLAGQWAPLISARLSATIYVSPVDGRELFDRAEFTRQGVVLQFLDFKPFIYDTRATSSKKTCRC